MIAVVVLHIGGSFRGRGTLNVVVVELVKVVAVWRVVYYTTLQTATTLELETSRLVELVE